MAAFDTETRGSPFSKAYPLCCDNDKNRSESQPDQLVVGPIGRASR